MFIEKFPEVDGHKLFGFSLYYSKLDIAKMVLTSFPNIDVSKFKSECYIKNIMGKIYLPYIKYSQEIMDWLNSDWPVYNNVKSAMSCD